MIFETIFKTIFMISKESFPNFFFLKNQISFEIRFEIQLENLKVWDSNRKNALLKVVEVPFCLAKL